jgi:hypothetical protein
LRVEAHGFACVWEGPGLVKAKRGSGFDFCWGIGRGL